MRILALIFAGLFALSACNTTSPTYNSDTGAPDLENPADQVTEGDGEAT